MSAFAPTIDPTSNIGNIIMTAASMSRTAAARPRRFESLFSAAAFGFVALLPGASSAHAQEGRVGTLLVAHGADSAWNAPVLDIARAAETGGPVEVAFLMGDHTADFLFQDAVAKLEAAGAERVVVVPLLASSHSSHYEQIRWLTGETEELNDMMMHHLHMGGIHRAHGETPLHLTPALDQSPEIAPILVERALALVDEPSEHALFIVGHGPNSAEDNALWMKNLREVMAVVARETGFRDVKLGLLRDDAPEEVRAEAVRSIRETIGLQKELTGRPVAVVPVLVSRGYLGQVKIPRDLDGLDIAYVGEGLLPHMDVARWVERRVRDAVAAITQER